MISSDKLDSINSDLSDDQAADKIGLEIAELLNLRATKKPEWSDPRYNTDFGTKTARGLARSVARVFGL